MAISRAIKIGLFLGTLLGAMMSCANAYTGPKSNLAASDDSALAKSKDISRVPAPNLSAAEEAAKRWEEEAMRQGRFVCTNPAHRHQLSSQMMMLRDDDETSNVRRQGE